MHACCFTIIALVIVYASDTIIEAVPVNVSQATEATGLRAFMFAARESKKHIYVPSPALILITWIVSCLQNVCYEIQRNDLLLEQVLINLSIQNQYKVTLPNSASQTARFEWHFKGVGFRRRAFTSSIQV